MTASEEQLTDTTRDESGSEQQLLNALQIPDVRFRSDTKTMQRILDELGALT